MYSSFVLPAMVLSIQLSYLFFDGLAFFNLFFRWSIWIRALFNCAHRPLSPRGKAKRKRCSGFLWSWTRSPLENESWKFFDDIFLWVHDSLAVPPSCLKRELLNNFIALRLSLIPSSLISTLWASDTSPRIKPNRAIKKDLTASRKGIHIQHPPPYASCLNDWNWVFLNWESDSGWPIGVPVHREARHPRAFLTSSGPFPLHPCDPGCTGTTSPRNWTT